MCSSPRVQSHVVEAALCAASLVATCRLDCSSFTHPLLSQVAAIVRRGCRCSTICYSELSASYAVLDSYDIQRHNHYSSPLYAVCCFFVVTLRMEWSDQREAPSYWKPHRRKVRSFALQMCGSIIHAATVNGECFDT